MLKRSPSVADIFLKAAILGHSASLHSAAILGGNYRFTSAEAAGAPHCLQPIILHIQNNSIRLWFSLGLGHWFSLRSTPHPKK